MLRLRPKRNRRIQRDQPIKREGAEKGRKGERRKPGSLGHLSDIEASVSGTACFGKKEAWQR